MKNFFLIVVLSSAVATARAGSSDYLLLWQVEDPVVELIGGGSTQLSDLVDQFGNYADSVRVAVTDTSTGGVIDYLNFWYYNPTPTDTPPVSTMWLDDEFAAGPTYANIGDYTQGSYTFAIELGNYNNSTWNVMAVSESYTYQDLISRDIYNHISAGDLSLPGYMAWTGGAYVVPEPGGGLMLLIGVGVLALRRRVSGMGREA